MSPASGKSGGAATGRRGTDRAAAVRAALRRLVAERGFHGASMSAVAKEAGVATGTAYVHYESKDELVVAAYVEAKDLLGAAGASAADPETPPRERFISIWVALYRYFDANPDEARFLIQVEGSPYAGVAHTAAIARPDDPLMQMASAPDLAARLLPFSPEVLYELGLAPAAKLAAREDVRLDDDQLEAIAESCWRAVSHA